MPLSIVFGTAFEVPVVDPDNPRVRDYRTADHRRHYVGHESSEIVHVCNEDCLAQALPNEYVECTKPGLFVSVHPFAQRHLIFVRTADVVDFDPGDDPYVLCGACETELLRDDARFEAMFGHPITREDS